MTTAYNSFDDEQDDVLMMNPSPDDTDAEFGDEGSGATSGYGDADEDDLADDLDEEPLEDDLDDNLRGDDMDDDDM